jgi:hypothetical protein
MVLARLLCKQCLQKKNSLSVYTVWIQFCVPAQTRTNWAVQLYDKSLRIYQDWPAHRARTAHACLVTALPWKKLLTGFITFQTSILKVVFVYILTNWSTQLFCKTTYSFFSSSFICATLLATDFWTHWTFSAFLSASVDMMILDNTTETKKMKEWQQGVNVCWCSANIIL